MVKRTVLVTKIAMRALTFRGGLELIVDQSYIFRDEINNINISTSALRSAISSGWATAGARSAVRGNAPVSIVTPQLITNPDYMKNMKNLFQVFLPPVDPP